MLIATSNKAKKLILLTYVGHLRRGEVAGQLEDIKALLVGFPKDFRVLADFSHLESMDADCAPEIGRIMEAADRVGVAVVVRVMPDSSKDPGLNIMTTFHYRHRPRVVTCETFVEALRALDL